jgi:hypothetical protein
LLIFSILARYGYNSIHFAVLRIEQTESLNAINEKQLISRGVTDLKKLIYIDCSRFIKIHHVQSLLNARQLAVWMERFIQFGTTISELLSRYYLTKEYDKIKAA